MMDGFRLLYYGGGSCCRYIYIIEHAVNNQTCCCRQRDMETPRDEAECTQNIQLLTVYTLLSQSQFGIMILQLALIANCLPRLIQHNDKATRSNDCTYHNLLIIINEWLNSFLTAHQLKIVPLFMHENILYSQYYLSNWWT